MQKKSKKQARRFVACSKEEINVVNLEATELDKLFDAANKNERHLAFIMFSYYHAARRSESLALRGTDVANGCVRIRRAKQRLNAIVNVQPLHQRERALIERLAALAGDGRVFPYSA